MPPTAPLPLPRARGLNRAASLAAAALLVALAGASPAAADSRPPVVVGSAVSVVEEDLRELSVVATAEAGVVRFAHEAPAGLSQFSGHVRCLEHEGGTVHLTGSVVRGSTAAGVVLDGRDFGFTLELGTSPQSFSLPFFGARGTLAPCSGSPRPQVPVTGGGLRVVSG